MNLMIKLDKLRGKKIKNIRGEKMVSSFGFSLYKMMINVDALLSYK